MRVYGCKGVIECETLGFVKEGYLNLVRLLNISVDLPQNYKVIHIVSALNEMDDYNNKNLKEINIQLNELVQVQTTKLNQQLQTLLAKDDEIIRVKSERDALAAQAEALRSAIEPFATGGVCSAIDREDYSIMRERIKDWHGAIEFKKAQDAYNSTPQQCLRDVQAEAGRAGFIAGFNFSYEGFNSEYGASEKVISTLADEYAATVRKGGA